MQVILEIRYMFMEARTSTPHSPFVIRNLRSSVPAGTLTKIYQILPPLQDALYGIPQLQELLMVRSFRDWFSHRVQTLETRVPEAMVEVIISGSSVVSLTP